MAIEQARNAAVLGLDLTSTTWWSTRLLLVALLAADHTEAEVIAFLDGERFVGTARLGAVRRALAALPGHGMVQAAYGTGMAAVPPQGTIRDIVEAIAQDPRERGEPNIKIDVTEEDPRQWLGEKLCDDAILDPRSAPKRRMIRNPNSKGAAVLNARRASNRGKSKRRLKTTPVFG
jgi:hypothetical protein